MRDADDLVHDSLIAAFQQLQACKAPPADLQANLPLAFYRRITLLARRRLGRLDGLARRANGSHAPVKNGLMSRPWIEVERVACALEAPLAALDLPSREVLALVAIEQFSYAEAAFVLDMTVAQLLPRLAVARAKLTSEIAGASQPHLRLAGES